MQLIQDLQALGLNDKEARVYVSALQLGLATVQDLAESAEINRTTTYNHVRNLIERGMIVSHEKQGKIFFVAEKPENFYKLIEAKEEEIKKQQQVFFDMLPELKALYNISLEKPKIRLFEGLEGLEEMQRDILYSREQVMFGFYCLDLVFDVFPDIYKNYSKLRVKEGIRSKIIYTKKAGQMYFEDDVTRLRERRFVPYDYFPFQSDVTIYGNKIAIASLKNTLHGIIINNAKIAESFKLLFSLAWEGAKKYN
ncbi:MAG TPA: helix-turn-helix domain-containing protein [Candidatus Bipolaricaulota bacterium]|nr:helix-turn-helix domain-containing protein [Candidatus Bipolaricaulota bacterium]